jgi:hypothetical protein
MVYPPDSDRPCCAAVGTLHPLLCSRVNSNIAYTPMADSRMSVASETMTMWASTFKFQLAFYRRKYIVNHYGPPCLFNRLIFSSAKRPFKYHLQHISWDDYPSRNNLTSQVPSARWQRNVEREADDNRSDQTIWASNLHSWQKSFIWCH